MNLTIDINDLHLATAQEVFDTITNHLLTQRAAATLDGGRSCFYLTPEGKRCAAGCLIPANRYSEGLENTPWSGVAQMLKLPNPYIHGDLIGEFQRAHDANASRFDFVAEVWRAIQTIGLRHRLRQNVSLNEANQTSYEFDCAVPNHQFQAK